MNKYPVDKPFGEWTPEQQREFKIDTLVDGKLWETKFRGEEQWTDTRPGSLPNFFRESYYRLAPKPEIPDSIDWSHVHPDFTVLDYRPPCARLWGANVPSTRAGQFASYKRGNMKSCTVYRPGFDPEREE